MKKILLTMVIIFAILIMPSAYGKASDRAYKSIDEITYEEITTASINFSKAFYKEGQLSAKDVIPVYDLNNRLIGFSVSYYLNDIPFGYINFDFTDENFVNDFVIQENCLSLFDGLLYKAELDENKYKVEKKLFKGKALEYSVPFWEGNRKYYYNSYDGIITKKAFKTKIKKLEIEYGDYDNGTVYVYCSDLFNNNGMTNGSTVLDGPTYTTKYSLTLSALSEAYIEGLTSKYACTVMALTEIAGQEGILVNVHQSQADNISDTFNALWVYTGTTGYDVNNGIIYGTTPDANTETGMLTYCTIRGKSNTVSSSQANPTYAFFKSAIDNSYSATFSFRYYTYDDSNNIIVNGHTVNVLGYCMAMYSGSTSYYIIVADGWNTSLRYLNVYSSDFVNSTGVSFNIA